MISPFKAVLGGDYKVVEKRLLAAIHIRFGLPPVLADDITQAIKAADRGAAYLEATQLAGFAEAEAKRLFGRDPGSARRDAAGLPDAMDRGQGREAVSGPVRGPAPAEPRYLNRLSRRRARGPIIRPPTKGPP